MNFAKFANFFIEQLRTDACDTVTESSLENSAQNDKFCMISPIDV